MERIAVISDIHGNLEALKAVLNDIKSKNITRIICLGDIIHKGVHQHECIKLVRENCEVVLRGNCDDFFSKEHDLSTKSEIEAMRIKWLQSILTEEEKNFLQSLPLTHEFYLSGSLIRLFHSTPYSEYVKISLFDGLDKWYKMFLPSDSTKSNKNADVAIFGHIHAQFINSRYNKTLINCGSVGNNLEFVRNEQKESNNLETTRACYLIIEGEYNSQEYSTISFQLVKVMYDIKKELNSEIYNPEKESYQYEIKNGKYRDLKNVYEQFRQLGIDVDNI